MATETGSPVGTPRAVSPAWAVLDSPGVSARKYLSVRFGFSFDFFLCKFDKEDKVFYNSEFFEF